MNKTAVKNFAVWAREKLISDIKYKAQTIGITENGIAEKLPQSTKDMQFFDIGTKNYAEVAGDDIAKRNALVGVIKSRERSFKTYQEAFANVVEEVAYTWFNRLIAIRFMEVNDYLPSGVRVLSADNPAKKEPDIVTKPFETDLEFTADEQSTILRYKDENKPDELFRLLFIKQCNKLHEILPELFEKTNDYSELLLNLSVIDQDGIIYHLIHDIPEEDFNIEMGGQVEIIGWLYQYYNTELKDDTYAKLKKNIKIAKDRIPAATQLFTPDWIVRYMVENSLGRLWIEGHPNDALKANWKYYLEEAEQEQEVQAQLATIRAEYAALAPEDIKIIDPCMGSGHILIYAFEVLMQIYEVQGYSERDAAQLIVRKNLYGLDIDKRAAQLAYFAVMMKARQYDRRFFTREIQPKVFAIEESNDINREQLKYFGFNMSELERSMAETQMLRLLDMLKDAKEYGAILNIEPLNWKLLYQYTGNVEFDGQVSFDSIGIEDTAEKLRRLVETAATMSQEYDIVCTNPPYMGMSNLSTKVNDLVKKYYPDSKADLFAVFIERCGEMVRTNGYQAMITMHSWMFLSSFEKLRLKILKNRDIVNMAHLGARAFEEIGGEVVQTTSFVLQKQNINDYKGTYCRLIEPTTQQGKEEMFLAGENRYTSDQSNFAKIPGSPVAYWVSEKFIEAFEKGISVDSISDFTGSQHITADNEKFLRLFWEVNDNYIGYQKTWAFYAKGGEYRKWYGNNEIIVKCDNYAMQFYKQNATSNCLAEKYWFAEGITYSAITSKGTGFRYYPPIGAFDKGGATICYVKKLYYVLGVLNSIIAKYIFSLLNPTINLQVKDVKALPIILSEVDEENVDMLCRKNVNLSKTDWDSYETSWDFQRNPLVNGKSLPAVYAAWKDECEERFLQLKANEEELNRIFIDIYGLQDELTPEVADKDITVHRVYDRKEDVPESMQGSKYIRTMRDEIVSLISYAVGCMLGRYSLDVEGLAYAGGEWDASRYSTFTPDRDNCIPITDEEYFEDDIVGLFCTWLKKAYGEETLEQNLDFIAAALGNKSNTSREVIRNYFLNDFIKDHMKTYQKRPIYWLFDSGKQNGFKALVYMHRWNADTIGNVRVEYLHRIQRVYEKEITRMQEIIDSSHDNKEIANATKRKEKLQKQLKETKDYDALIAHLALSRIDIDLDDGVKVNYEKVQTADGRKMQILAKI